LFFGEAQVIQEPGVLLRIAASTANASAEMRQNAAVFNDPSRYAATARSV
jgi:hypothetical protein